MRKLDEIQPREDVGRKTIARFQMQFRAAAFACLDILEGKQTDRVYCDYHDDFVLRKTNGSKYFYVFHQVKTKDKRNHQWTLNEIFGLKKRGQACDEEALKKIRNSFVGRMLLHTINFPESCLKVTLLTNVQFDDDVEKVIKDLDNVGDFVDNNLKFLADNFLATYKIDTTFDSTKIESHLRKISLEPGVKYLSLDGSDFIELAKSAIYKYSEIDLEHLEATEIIENLINLVEKKSFSKIIPEITEAQLDDLAGIGLDDLLKILSISKGAYLRLIQGGDEKALKNASILQRKLTTAGATISMIEFCTQQKVEWDIWLRDARHSIPEFELNFLIQKLNDLQKIWMYEKRTFQWLSNAIGELLSGMRHQGISTLTRELLLGGVFSSLVRSES